MIHSDQGAQFTSKEWQSFLSKHNLAASMSRRRNCHDNAVAEIFVQLSKRERIRRQTYLTRNAARQDVCDYIEPPRVYRRVKLSKDDPYDTAQTYPVLYG